MSNREVNASLEDASIAHHFELVEIGQKPSVIGLCAFSVAQTYLIDTKVEVWSDSVLLKHSIGVAFKMSPFELGNFLFSKDINTYQDHGDATNALVYGTNFGGVEAWYPDCSIKNSMIVSTTRIY